MVSFGSLLSAQVDSPDAVKLPEVQLRYESMLLRSPGPGRAFEEVFQYHFAHDSLDVLMTRWAASRASDKPNADYQYGLLLALLESKLGNVEKSDLILQELVARYLDQSQPALLLARSKADQGLLAEAEAHFRLAIKRDLPPLEELDVYRELALVQQRNFNREGALKTWKTLLQANREDPDIKEEVAAALADADFYDEALQYYRDIETDFADDMRLRLRVILRQADIEELRGNFTVAVDQYKRALGLSAPGGWIYREIMANIEGLYSRRDNLEGYAGFLQERLQEFPQELETALLLGEVQFRLGREDEALALYQRLSKAAPGRSDIQFEYGRALLRNQRYEESASVFSGLKEKKPESWDYRQALGEVYWRQYESTGDEAMRSSAVAEWSGLLSLKMQGGASPSADYLVQIGDLFRQYGVDEEAVAHYRMAIDTTPESFDLRERLALFYFSIDKKGDAWEVLESYPLEWAGVEYFMRVAQFQKQYGRNAHALQTIMAGLELDPDNYPLLELRWRLLIETSQWEEAIAGFEAIRESAPNEFVLNDLETRYIQLLRSAGLLAERKEALLRALKQAETSVDDSDGVGDGYAGSNRVGLDEREMRLLVRMVLGDSQPQLAREILFEAERHFPESFLLARLKADFWKNYGNLEQQIAAWRDLIRIRPLRKAEWLHQIVLVYRQQALWTEAMEAAQAYLDAFPADAQAYQLYADVCFDAGKMQAGNNSLKTAIRLADNTFPLKLRLAREYYQQNRFREARVEYEDAFFEADTLEQRQSVIQPLVELHLAEGTLDQLIHKFQKKLGNRLASWEYHLYLADIFLQAEDLKQARDSLQQALQFRPDDVKLLRRLIRLAREENRTGEWVQFAYRLSQVDPTPGHEIGLAQALYYDGQHEEASALLHANLQYMATDTANFSDLLPVLAELNIFSAEEDSEILKIDQMDSKLLFSAASVFIIKRKLDEAEKLLWELLNRQYERVRNPEMSSAGPETYQERIGKVGRIRRDFQQLMGLSSAVEFNRFSARFTPRNLTDAQTAALIYLSGMASINDGQGAFLEKLDDLLNSLETPIAERAMCFLQIQARLQFLREIGNLIDSGEYNSELYAFLHEILGNTVRHPTAGQDKESMQELMFRLEEQMMAFEPDQAARVFISEVSKYLQVGATHDAESYLERIDANSDRMNPETTFQLAQLYLKSGTLDQCRSYMQMGLAKISGGESEGESDLSDLIALQLDSLILQYAQKIVRENSWEPGDGELLAELVLHHLVRKMANRNRASRTNVNLNINLRFPMPTPYADQAAVAFLRQLSLTVHTLPLGEFYLAALRSSEQSPRSRIVLRAGIIHVFESWWAGNRQKALRGLESLVKNEGVDGEVTLRLLLGQLRTEMNLSREALSILDALGRLPRGQEVMRQLLIFENARAVQDLTIIKASLRELMLLQPIGVVGFNLAAELRRYHLEAEYKQLSPVAFRHHGTKRRNPNTVKKEIKQLIASKNYEEAELLCRQTLNDSPPGPRASPRDSVRLECLQNLYTLNKLDEYIDELEKQLAASPESVRLIHRLVETYDVRSTRASSRRLVNTPAGASVSDQGDGNKVRLFLKRLVELRPNEDYYLRLYAADLRKNRQFRELANLYETLLANNFEKTFRQYNDLSSVMVNNQRVENLLNLLDDYVAAKTSGPSFSGLQHQMAAPLHKLGQLLREKNYSKESIKVWEYALALLPPDRTADMRKLLLREYLANDSVEKAADLVAGFFLTEIQDVSRSMWFGRLQPIQPHAWLQVTQMVNNRTTLPAMELLRSVQENEKLKDSLLNRAHKRLKGENPEENLVARAFLVALTAVDESDQNGPRLALETKNLLNYLSAHENLSNATLGYLIKSNLLTVINRELPMTDDILSLKREILEASLSAWDRNNRNFDQRIRGRFELLEFHRSAGDELAMKGVTQDLALIMNEQFVARRGMINVGDSFRLLETLLDLSLLGEASVWVKELKTSSRITNNHQNQLILLRFEQEIDLLQGKTQFPVVRVWVENDPGISVSDGHTVYWEIGPEAIVDSVNGSQWANLSVYNRDYPNLDGQYNLDIVIRHKDGSRRRLASLDAVESRGKLSVPDLETEGVIYGRLVTRSQPPLSFDGLEYAFVKTPNLIEAPEPESRIEDEGISADSMVTNRTTNADAYTRWLPTTAMTIVEEEGGIDSDDRCLVMRTDGNRERTIKSPIMSISADENYHFSLWMKFTEKNRAGLNWIYIDKSGRVIGESGPAFNGRILPGLWSHFSGTIAGREIFPPGALRLPTGTVAMQAVLKIRGTVRVDGMYLGQIPDLMMERN